MPDAAPEAAPAPPARVDLNQTSFLLSPPEWFQEAADKLGIPDRGRGRALRCRRAVRWSAGIEALPDRRRRGRGPLLCVACVCVRLRLRPAPTQPARRAGCEPVGPVRGGPDARGPGPTPTRCRARTGFACRCAHDRVLAAAGWCRRRAAPPDAKTALISGGSGLPRDGACSDVPGGCAERAPQGGPNVPGGPRWAGAGSPPPARLRRSVGVRLSAGGASASRCR